MVVSTHFLSLLSSDFQNHIHPHLVLLSVKLKEKKHSENTSTSCHLPTLSMQLSLWMNSHCNSCSANSPLDLSATLSYPLMLENGLVSSFPEIYRLLVALCCFTVTSFCLTVSLSLQSPILNFLKGVVLHSKPTFSCCFLKPSYPILNLCNYICLILYLHRIPFSLISFTSSFTQL